jgi:hypothetical protein
LALALVSFVVTRADDDDDDDGDVEEPAAGVVS